MTRRGKTWALAAWVLWLVAAPAFATDTVYYYLSDTLHSEVVVTDQNRNVVEQTNYAPYGQVLNRQLRDGLGYTGHEEDPETGLVYMQQRYYDAQSGLFLSTDPVLPTSGGGNFNRYWYASDNPYRYLDLDGEADTQPIPAPGPCNAGSGCARGGDQAVPQAANKQEVQDIRYGFRGDAADTTTVVVDDSYRRGLNGPQRAVGAVMSAVFGTAFDLMKRPSNPTYVPPELEHQLFMTGGVAVAAAASPDAVALGATALPVAADAAGPVVAPAAIAVRRYGRQAVMAGCLAIACKAGNDPGQFAEQKAELEKMTTGLETVVEDIYNKVVIPGNK